MLRSRKLRGVIAAGAVLAAVSGIAFAQTPAMADPQTTLVVVGSDTIQDVWNGFTNGSPAATGFAAVPAALSPGQAASYNATNPADGTFHQIITPQDGWALQNGIVPNPLATFPLAPGNCNFDRPNGSGEGVANLRLALNASSTHAGAAVAPVAGLGCVDIARSSSGVDTTDNNPAVDIQWVPFAIDAVTMATGPSTCSGTPNPCPSFTADLGNSTTQNVTTVQSTLGSAIGNMTVAQISSLYNCNPVPVTVGSTTTTYIGTVIGQSVPTGDVGVDLYVPQSGSGTRKFWEGSSAANFLDSTVDTATGCVHDYIVGGVLGYNPPTQAVKVPVEEHDGTAVSTDPIGVDPFSIAQYISQQNPSHNPRFHGAVLQPIVVSGVVTSPYNTAGTPSSGLNTSFPILRYVYDVVKLSRLTASGDPVGTLLNGVGSTICHAHSLITGYGFALMSTSVFQDVACGAVLTSNEGAP
jgi:hypothetical protein